MYKFTLSNLRRASDIQRKQDNRGSTEEYMKVIQDEMNMQSGLTS